MPALSSRTIWSRVALVIFGTLLALATLEGAMRSAGYVMRLRQKQRNQQALSREHQIRVLCLGESTTAGSTEHGAYPEMLEEILNRQEVGVQFAVINRGRIGATTNEIIDGLEADLDEFKPHLVVVMMGINDGGKTHAWGSLIAPGSGRWYGSFRLYKLYRLLRFALERRLNPIDDGDVPPMAEAIDRSEAYVDDEEVPGIPTPLPEVRELLHEAVDLIDRGEHKRAESILIDVLRDHPQLPKPYVELARIYHRTDRPEEAHRLLLRGVDTVPRPSLPIYGALAHSHYVRGQMDAAIRTYQYIIDSLIAPTQIWDQTYYRVALAEMFEDSGQLDLAERTLIQVAEEVDPWNDIAHRYLIEFYERQGKRELAAQRRAVQLHLQREYVNPATRQNFHTLRAALDARRLPLIAVQYPSRELETLKRILNYDGSVIYVDNGFFKDLAETNGYKTLFVDRFAGDFGHLSFTANRLLAQNVARSIVEEFFGVPFRELPPDTDSD